MIAKFDDFPTWRARFIRKEASPVDYIDTLEQQFQLREPDVCAFVVSDWKKARERAAESQARYLSGNILSPLEGLPFGVKDIIETADFPTQMQSPIFEGFHSRRNAAVVRRLIEGGAIPVGKTVTQEFACGASGPTRNPHDLARTPGGSSSGSAAAVAAGMIPFALGTQTRASTIRPASYCGVWGLKPSHNLISLAGVHPVATSQDTIGLFASSLPDLSAGFEWLAPLARRARQKPLGRLIAIRTRGFDQIDQGVETLFAQALSAMKPEFIIDGLDSPAARSIDEAIKAADELIYDIMACETQWPYADYRRTHENGLSEHICKLLDRGSQLSPAAYSGLMEQRERLRHDVCRILQPYDAAISLSASGVAPHGLDYTGSRSFALPWSLMGGPSLSMPVLDLDGLPIGIQVMMPPGHDMDCLELARRLTKE